MEAHQRARADVLDLMRRLGMEDRVAEAEATLPEVVDLRRDADRLRRLGLSVDTVVDRLGGTI